MQRLARCSAGIPKSETSAQTDRDVRRYGLRPTQMQIRLLAEAIDLVRREGRASVSMLQRRMRIGYTRAARIVDMMEDKGIVGPPEGTSQLRQILDYGPTAPPKDDGA